MPSECQPQPDLISQREACRLFERIGVDRESARRLLRTGLLGPGVRLRGAVLHDRARIEAFVTRHATDWTALAPIPRRPTMLLRARLREPDERSPVGWRGVDLTAPVEEQLRALEQAWRMSSITRIQLKLMLEGHQVTGEDFVPLWVAVSGFIVFGAEIVEVGWETGRGKAGTLLRLREAGDWWPQGPNGRSLLGADPRLGRGGSPWQLLERYRPREPLAPRGLRRPGGL